VEFNISAGVGLQSRLIDLLRIEAKLFHGLADGDSIRVRQVQQSFVKSAHQRAAADEGYAEANSLFFGESKDFDRIWKPCPGECLEQGDPQHHAENSVVCARIWDSVEMGANEQC